MFKHHPRPERAKAFTISRQIFYFVCTSKKIILVLPNKKSWKNGRNPHILGWKNGRNNKTIIVVRQILRVVTIFALLCGKNVRQRSQTHTSFYIYVTSPRLLRFSKYKHTHFVNYIKSDALYFARICRIFSGQ